MKLHRHITSLKYKALKAIPSSAVLSAPLQCYRECIVLEQASLSAAGLCTDRDVAWSEPDIPVSTSAAVAASFLSHLDTAHCNEDDLSRVLVMFVCSSTTHDDEYEYHVLSAFMQRVTTEHDAVGMMKPLLWLFPTPGIRRCVIEILGNRLYDIIRGAGDDAAYLAAGNGLVDLLRELLPLCNINAIAPASSWPVPGTLLHMAAYCGDLDILQLLIDNGSDLEALDSLDPVWHMRPIHRATLRGHTQAVRLLINRGADVNATCSISGYATCLVIINIIIVVIISAQ